MNDAVQLIAIALLVIYLVGKVMGPVVILQQKHKCSKTTKALMKRILDPRRYPVSTTACRGIVSFKRDPGGLQWTETLHESLLHVVAVSVSDDELHITFTDSKVPIRGQWTVHIHPSIHGSNITLEAVYTITSTSWHTPIWTLMLRLTSSKSVWMYLNSVTAE